MQIAILKFSVLMARTNFAPDNDKALDKYLSPLYSLSFGTILAAHTPLFSAHLNNNKPNPTRKWGSIPVSSRSFHDIVFVDQPNQRTSPIAQSAID